jgi:dolichol-phosphate mannosyltransferase
LIAVLAAFVQIIGRILHPELPQGISLIIVISLFLGAINLMSLAFIAEYIAKIFEEVKQRPQFVVTKLVNFEEASQSAAAPADATQAASAAHH